MADRVIIVQKANKTVYREGNVIVKKFVPGHPKAGVYNEAYIHACVEQTGLPVPKLISVQPGENGGTALTMAYVEGRTLEEQMREAPEKTDEYLEKFIDIQMEVNSKRVITIRNTRYKMIDAVESLKEIDASTRYELLQRIHGMKRHTKLCHGDFVPSNVILRSDGTFCVLDWAHATHGNAGADAAITYMRFSLENPELADKYLKMYCKKADMAIQYIQRWMPVVAAAQLAKGNKDEEKLLREWISVAEYQ